MVAGSNPARLIPLLLVLNIRIDNEILMVVAVQDRAKTGLENREGKTTVDERISDLTTRIAAAVGFMKRLNILSASQMPTEQQVDAINKEIVVHRRLKEDVDLYWEEANRQYLDNPTKENKRKRMKIGSMQADIKEIIMPEIERKRARLVLKLRKDDREAREVLDNAESGKNKWDFFGKVGLALSGVSLAIATISDKGIMGAVGLKNMHEILPAPIFGAPMAYAVALLGLTLGLVLIARERISHYLSERKKEEAKTAYLRE